MSEISHQNSDKISDTAKDSRSTTRIWAIFAAIAAAVIAIDQIIKQIFLRGFRWDGDFFSLILTFNDGVAFSMLAFMGPYLKYAQMALLLALIIYLARQREFLRTHLIAFALIMGGGISNVLDRFTQGAVVDYVFWHKWFEFAVFNFADVMIDIGIALIIIREIFMKKR